MLGGEPSEKIILPDGLQRRGRGRPRRNNILETFGLPNSNQKMDPTGEMFLRTESRTGGPTDPYYSFEDNVKFLFGQRFPDPKEHPMREFLFGFAWQNTPKNGDNIAEVKK